MEKCVCNAMTEINFAQTFHVCKATPKQVNDIKSLLKNDVINLGFMFQVWIFICIRQTRRTIGTGGARNV